MVESVQQLRKDREDPVGVFANYVYDMKSLLRHHPNGYRIIDGIKYREFDRYLYGMYRTERDPKVPPNVHTFKALTLVGEPIAKINIPPIYQNLEKDVYDVNLKEINVVSEVGQIYHVELEAKEGPAFKYIGYHSVNQLGRFFSLTMNKKVTRLYTSVGFLDAKNR